MEKMSYWINKLLYDMNPALYERLKAKDETVFTEYPVTPEERQALWKSIDEKAFKPLYDMGVIPVLLFTFARQCGCSVSEYTELLKQ